MQRSDPDTKQLPSVGDWVRSYEAGIWQVYRVLTYVGRDPVSGSDQQRTSVFSKRFLNNSFRRSFKSDCCDVSLIEQLDGPTTKKLADFIASNEALYQAFCEYAPEPIDVIYSARVGIPKEKTVQDVESQLSGCPPLRETEIHEFLADAGIGSEGFPYWTIQFISNDHETIDDYLVYRFLRVLG